MRLGVAVKKLPVWQAFMFAVRAFFKNIAVAFSISWPWLVLRVLSLLWLTISIANDSEFTSVAWFALIVSFIILVVVYSNIAVRWHRYLSTGEASSGLRGLRFDGAMGSYFVNVIVLAIIFVMALVAIALPFQLILLFAGFDPYSVAVLGLYAAILPVMVLGLRLSIKLPAVALGHFGFGLGSAMSATSGNFWRLAGLSLLVFLPGIAVRLFYYPLQMAAYLLGDAMGSILILAVKVVLEWAVVIISLSVLTGLYGFFVQGRTFEEEGLSTP